MKKMSTKELAKKVYDKVTELGIKNQHLALTLTFKYLRYTGVDCDLFELSPVNKNPIINSSPNVILVIEFNNQEEVMRSDSLFVPNEYKDWFALDASEINLNTVKAAQLFFAKVNTGMFKI